MTAYKKKRSFVINDKRKFLNKEFPAQYIANMSINVDGLPRGYLFSLKMKIVNILDLHTEISVSDISTHLGISQIIIKTWQKMHKDRLLIKSTRDNMYSQSNVAPTISANSYETTIRNCLRTLSKERKLNSKQMDYIGKSLINTSVASRRTFNTDDGDSQSLTTYINLLIDYVITNDNDYKNIPTVQEVVQNATLDDTINQLAKRVSNASTHLQILNKLEEKHRDPDGGKKIPVFHLSHPPLNGQDILYSIHVSDQWRTLKQKNIVLGNLLDYSTNYIGPKISTKSIPLTAIRKVEDQIVRMPNGGYIVLGHLLYTYILNLSDDGGWDWDVLLKEHSNSPFVHIDITMRSMSQLMTYALLLEQKHMVIPDNLNWKTWDAYMDPINPFIPQVADAQIQEPEVLVAGSDVVTVPPQLFDRPTLPSSGNKVPMSDIAVIKDPIPKITDEQVAVIEEEEVMVMHRTSHVEPIVETVSIPAVTVEDITQIKDTEPTTLPPPQLDTINARDAMINANKLSRFVHGLVVNKLDADALDLLDILIEEVTPEQIAATVKVLELLGCNKCKKSANTLYPLV